MTCPRCDGTGLTATDYCTCQRGQDMAQEHERLAAEWDETIWWPNNDTEDGER